VLDYLLKTRDDGNNPGPYGIALHPRKQSALDLRRRVAGVSRDAQHGWLAVEPPASPQFLHSQGNLTSHPCRLQILLLHTKRDELRTARRLELLARGGRLVELSLLLIHFVETQ
jgi:hypothetical protein